MRATAFIFGLLLAPCVAAAHDTRPPPGAAIRYVTATPVADCDTATWPDIPPSCLVRAQPAPAAKGGRLRVAESEEARGDRMHAPAPRRDARGPRVLAGMPAANPFDIPSGFSERVAYRQGT